MADIDAQPAKKLRLDTDPAASKVELPATAPPGFKKDFTKPMAIPEDGIAAAVQVMQSGRLFRYCAKSADESQVSQAEVEFAAMCATPFHASPSSTRLTPTHSLSSRSLAGWGRSTRSA